MMDFRFISDDHSIEISYSYDLKGNRLPVVKVRQGETTTELPRWDVQSTKWNEQETVFDLEPCDNPLNFLRLRWYNNAHTNYIEIHNKDAPYFQYVWLDSNQNRLTQEKLSSRFQAYNEFTHQQHAKCRNKAFYESLLKIQRALGKTDKAKDLKKALKVLNIPDAPTLPKALVTQPCDLTTKKRSVLEILGGHRRSFWRGRTILTRHLKILLREKPDLVTVGLLRIFIQNYCEYLRHGLKIRGESKADKIEQQFDGLMLRANKKGVTDDDNATNLLNTLLNYRRGDTSSSTLIDLIDEKRFGFRGISRGGKELRATFKEALRRPSA